MSWTVLHPVILVVGLILLLFSNRDPWRLMAAGFLVSPITMPYHFIMFLPGIGRVKGWRQGVLWITSSLALVVAALQTDLSKWLALSFPLAVWLLLAPSLRLKAIWHDENTILRRTWNMGRDLLASIKKQPDTA